jgi:FtsP/CotA-like multicopper oxidase with cupredoxin domain
MKSMMGGTYWENVRKSFVPEFISMNFMMAGMAPVMSFLMMGRDMRAMEPNELLFWGVMSIGVIAGFTMAYPANVWLVNAGLKHGLMTERKEQTSGERHESHDSHGSKREGQTDDHGAKNESGHKMTTAVTTPQLAAVGGVSVLALAVGMVAPANWLNLRLSARDVGGAIMPPGMISVRDTPAEAMLDMAAVSPRDVHATYGLEVNGNRALAPRIENGVKIFDLETSVIRWTILPGVTVDAYAFNGQVPGPLLRFRQGDTVRINVTNRLPETTTVHWHGLILPNVMDGPAHITQEPIPTGGGVYHYEFTAVQSGTYLYHSHDHIDRQQALGLYGALIIDPVQPDPTLRADHEYSVLLQEWLLREGLTFPAMPMDGAQPNYFTINGRAYPATDTISMKVGETLRVRFIGSNNGFIHPMHIHGGPFTVVAIDGNTLEPSARYQADTVNVGPGQRYDVIWTARQPGKWLIHCHIGHHTTNNNVEMQGGGGLMVVINVTPAPA